MCNTLNQPPAIHSLLIAEMTSECFLFGAALHDNDPTLEAIGVSPKMRALLRDLNFKQPLPIQSTFIFKVRLCTSCSL